MRLLRYRQGGQEPIILHFGDHDPSGLDMTRDIGDRLELFMEHHGYNPPEIRRLALNMDQVNFYNPPPNPAKMTDSRYAGYTQKYGDESWELDALSPEVIIDLIRDEINKIRDQELWDGKVAQEEVERKLLQKVSDNWEEVVSFLNPE